MKPAVPSAPAAPVRLLVAGLFVLALGFNLWGVTLGWKHINLPGYEFRQTQTGISAYFIQQEHNFSLAYPTPVLGKPWSVPFEFPLYQWTVVATSNLLHLPLVEAARAVSAACFYLALVPLALLLRRLGLNAVQQAIALSLVLTCPLYIFYSRAFLIETMALMFSLWYLAALVAFLDRRSLGWLFVAAAAGTGAGLVKVTTFIVCLVPAFGWCLWALWSARPRADQPDRAALPRLVGWLVALHAVPFAATYWWVQRADAIKALNPSGATLTSASLAAFNFGEGRRLDPAIWSQWYVNITSNIASLPVLIAAAGLAAFAGRWRWPAFACLGLFLAAQLIFPVLYSFHAYYYVANAVFLLASLGFSLAGLLAKRIPAWVPLTAWVLVGAAQVHLYLGEFRQTQAAAGTRGGLAEALRALTNPDEAVIIAGEDWSSIIPYYAERRALMIRSDLTRRGDYLDKAYAAMQDTPVAALALLGPERDNRELRERTLQAFDLDPRPVLTWNHGGQAAVVYFSRQLRPYVYTVLAHQQFYETKVIPAEPGEPNPLIGHPFPYAKLLPQLQRVFRVMTPRPVRFYSTFGPELWDSDKPGLERYAAHPDTKLWFALAPGRHRLVTDIEISDSSWQNVPIPDASDGVEITADAVFADGRRERLNSRYLYPRIRPEDRGRQPVDWSFDLPAGAELEFAVNPGPAGNGARDWVTLGYITIQ